MQTVSEKERQSVHETHISYTERFRDKEFMYKALYNFSCLLYFSLLINVYHYYSGTGLPSNLRQTTRELVYSRSRDEDDVTQLDQPYPKTPCCI